MRIAILSPYPTVRAGLAALAREQPGWTVVQGPTAAPPGTATREDERDGVDVLLVEVEGDVSAGVASDWLERVRPARGVVTLGAIAGGAGRPDRAGPRDPGGRALALGPIIAIARLVTEAGLAFGALPRDASPEEIITATAAVAGGLTVLDRRLALETLAAVETPRLTRETLTDGDEPLTAREREVLQLLAQGIPNKQIAQRLRISEHTVKFHVSAIMTKLSAASRTEAVTTAARRGLLLL
ncbi:MAG TPA: response regulator transcription factor [Ktedonobacterales bacterium]